MILKIYSRLTVPRLNERPKTKTKVHNWLIADTPMNDQIVCCICSSSHYTKNRFAELSFFFSLAGVVIISTNTSINLNIELHTSNCLIIFKKCIKQQLLSVKNIGFGFGCCQNAAAARKHFTQVLYI